MKAVNLELLLPADFQPGERVLWHGRPQWTSMARRAFRVDLIAIYFGLMTVWNIASAGANAGIEAAAISGAKTIGAGLIAVALLTVLAFLSSRTSLYVVTTKRVVMKVGIALPIFFNLPFNSILGASVRVYDDGTGEIPLALEPKQHIAYLHLWPHAKPFHINRPEPSLRSVPDAAKVAEILSRALIAASNESHSRAASVEKTTPIKARDRQSYPTGSVAAA
jgi:hypothetical protein